MNFFLHNFIVQYINKSIVNIKVLLNKNLVMFLVLKTTQFCQEMVRILGRVLLFNSCDVVLWTELITKKGF